MGQSTVAEKRCTKCGILKPLDEFYLVNGRRESRCKDCDNARRRHRDHVRYTGVSDITPEQELAMRRKTRNCPLCDVRMTGKPGLPNSKHLDHIVPLGVGGTHTHGNCRVICADCNLRRPKDGSDYTGPVTLWAQGETQVGRLDGRRNGHMANEATCRNGLHPWTADNIVTVGGQQRCKACLKATRRRTESKRHPLRPCGRCGTAASLQGSQAMCAACVDVAARKAATLHKAGGLTWNQVATLVGYGSGEGARYAAKRIGYTPAPKPAKVSTGPTCPDCGQPRSGSDRWCTACKKAKAWRAVAMRREGATLREIAGTLGFTSKTSVTNLLKTVVQVEPKMGRPRKDESSLLSVT